MSIERKNYPAIDIAKFLCALVILFYHFFSEHGPVFWMLEDALSLYAVAVALFMALSGFLLFEKLGTITDRKAQWTVVMGQVKRILTIYALWSVPYLVFRVSTWNWERVDAGFILWELQEWIFQSTFYTIWFMPSLALGLVFAFFLYSRLNFKMLCLVACVFYIAGSLQTTYAFIGRTIPGFEAFAEFSATWLQGCRGGIFFGMPLVVLGAAVTRIQWRSVRGTAVLSLLMMLSLLAEALLLRTSVGGCGLDLAVAMLPTIFCFILFLTSLSWTPGCKAAYTWMRSMSILIFMSQRLFLSVIPSFLPEQQEQAIFENPYFGSLLIGGVTLLFSALIISGTRRYPSLKNLY